MSILDKIGEILHMNSMSESVEEIFASISKAPATEEEQLRQAKIDVIDKIADFLKPNGLVIIDATAKEVKEKNENRWEKFYQEYFGETVSADINPRNAFINKMKEDGYAIGERYQTSTIETNVLGDFWGKNLYHVVAGKSTATLKQEFCDGIKSQQKVSIYPNLKQAKQAASVKAGQNPDQDTDYNQYSCALFKVVTSDARPFLNRTQKQQSATEVEYKYVKTIEFVMR